MFVVAVITSQTGVIARRILRDGEHAPGLPLIGSNEGANVEEHQYNGTPPPDGSNESPKEFKITKGLINDILQYQSGLDDPNVNIYIVPSDLSNISRKTEYYNEMMPGWVGGMTTEDMIKWTKKLQDSDDNGNQQYPSNTHVYVPEPQNGGNTETTPPVNGLRYHQNMW